MPSPGATAAPPRPAPAPRRVGKAALPAVGVYNLKGQGYETIKRGVFPSCTNVFPADSTLTISQTEGESGSNSFNFDTRIYPNEPGHHDERQIYSYSADGSVTKSYSLVTIECGGARVNSELNYAPAQLRVAPDLKVGRTWTVDSQSGERKEHGIFTVDRIEEVLVGSHVYRTFVIHAKFDLSGSQSGTRDQTWWWYPPAGMSLQYHIKDDLQVANTHYANDVMLNLATTPVDGKAAR